MKTFGQFIVKHRVAVLIVALVLLLPCIYGMAMTKVNYDVLSYLPDNLDSMKGQKILDETFSSAAMGMLVVDNMPGKDLVKLKAELSKIDGIEKIIGITDFLDTSIPKQIIPDGLKSVFYQKDSTLLLVKFTGSTSSDSTQDAIKSMKKVMNKQCFLSGMSALVRDTIALADKETPIYVGLAILLSTIVLLLTFESTLIPLIFLSGIGAAILFNYGTNIFFGQISYITKALAAVLQLGVTMDLSIFLLHRYEEEKLTGMSNEEAMAEAIARAGVAIIGSALACAAGFLALCSMKLKLGFDIGIVMAKGVGFGVVSSLTILPAMILVFDKPIHRFKHKTLLPSFEKTSKLVTKYYKVFVIIFIIAFIPAIYGQQHTKVYYNLDESLPKNLDSIVALSKLKTDFHMTTTHMLVVSDKIPAYKINEMTKKLEQITGINKVISYDKYVGPRIPENFIPAGLKESFAKDGYKMIIANSIYKAATDAENNQIDEMNRVIKSYDRNAVIAGEGALTKDLVEIAGIDFKTVDYVSIGAVFVLILLIFTSLSIPIVLVLAIELAIFINMALAFYTGSTIPFIAPMVIGCIQLGATIDYAILLTTRFREELRHGHERFEAMQIAVQSSARSIVTSAFTFFAATIGVGVIASMEMIRTLCMMIARGALISTAIIILVLPSLVLVSEKIISVTSINWRKEPAFKLKLVEERE